MQEQRREDILKLLKESRCRRESRRTDVKWLDSTELIREDRNR